MWRSWNISRRIPALESFFSNTADFYSSTGVFPGFSRSLWWILGRYPCRSQLNNSEHLHERCLTSRSRCVLSNKCFEKFRKTPKNIPITECQEHIHYCVSRTHPLLDVKNTTITGCQEHTHYWVSRTHSLLSDQNTHITGCQEHTHYWVPRTHPLLGVTFPNPWS